MADTVRRVDYYKIETSNRVGEGAKILSALKDGKVDLLAYSGFPRRKKVQMDFVPKNPDTFKKAMKKAGVNTGRKKSCFHIQGKDRVGAVASILAKLADSGISVTALNALSAGKGAFAVILWVKPEDVRKASKALGAK